MSASLKDYEKVNRILVFNGINSILYGSLGVSVYLGNFRDFDDIDLLIDKKYLDSKWEFLRSLMIKNGFNLIDANEHEFINHEGVKVAFAEIDVLIRDKICDPVSDVVEILVGEVEVKTLNIKGFINAYTFSSTDGYRIDKRGDSDLNIVRKLKSLIE